MRRLASLTVIALLGVVVALGVLPRARGEAESPSLVGSWHVTIDGGQPVLLLVLSSDGSAIATDTDVVPFIGA